MAYATIQRGASKDGYFAVPAEGSSFFISQMQAVQFGVRENQELTESEFYQLRTQVLSQRCRIKAMDYLARREHGRRELELKLQQKNFPQEIIKTQLDDLAAQNLLSDERFAEQYIVSRQRKNPEGPAVLIMRLQQRGIDRSVAETVVQQWFSDEEAAQRAIENAAQRLGRKYADDTFKLTHELRRKGFSSAAIRAYLENRVTNDKCY